MFSKFEQHDSITLNLIKSGYIIEFLDLENSKPDLDFQGLYQKLTGPLLWHVSTEPQNGRQVTIRPSHLMVVGYQKDLTLLELNLKEQVIKEKGKHGGMVGDGGWLGDWGKNRILTSANGL